MLPIIKASIRCRCLPQDKPRASCRHKQKRLARGAMALIKEVCITMLSCCRGKQAVTSDATAMRDEEGSDVRVTCLSTSLARAAGTSTRAWRGVPLRWLKQDWRYPMGRKGNAFWLALLLDCSVLPSLFRSFFCGVTTPVRMLWQVSLMSSSSCQPFFRADN
jgi:hypothetical protein